MINIKEHSSISQLQLSAGDFSFLLANHSGHLKLESVADGKCSITTNSYVGFIKLPSGESFSIQPKVPVNNLLFMISHTYDLVNFKYIEKKELEEQMSIFEIYVIVLLNWIELLLKKGLFKTYLSHVENISGIKGKYLIDKNLMEKHRFWCSFDELTFSTLENKIIKATLRNILNFKLEKSIHQRALSYFRLFSDIENIILTKPTFKSVSYNRLNFNYKIIIDLCELIFNKSMLQDELGNHPFSGFMIDMNKVFERFILKILQKNLIDEKISSGRKANWAESLTGDFYLPVIEPDIVIDEKFIIDTKYYSSPLNDREKLHSNNLYQILTYMKSYELNGMLLYPESEKSFDNTYRVGEHTFTIQTINLFGSISELKIAINNLISSIKQHATKSKKVLLIAS